LSACPVGIAECTPNCRAAYEQDAITPLLPGCPPTANGFPISNGSSSSSTEQKKASKSTCMILRGFIIPIVCQSNSIGIKIYSMSSSTQFSYFNCLECSECRQEFDFRQVQTICSRCNTPLVVRYDLDAVKKHLSCEDFADRPPVMWRWHELLPVFSEENIVSLGEGDSPILPMEKIGRKLGLKHLCIKDERSQPDPFFQGSWDFCCGFPCERVGLNPPDYPHRW